MEPQSFSFSKERAQCCTDTREEMRCEGSTVITPPLSRRRMTPPTPVQISNSSFGEEQGCFEVKGSVELERRCHDISCEIQMLNKRQENFQDAIEGELSVQDRASERMQDRIIEEKRFGTQNDRRGLAHGGERA